jgi:DNA-binding response OmpR family regulator
MPIKDGFETVSDIRIWEASKKYSPIPIIALSANAMPEDIDRALKSGFSNYFTKPVNFPEFGRVLMELLAHRIPYTSSTHTSVTGPGVGGGHGGKGVKGRTTSSWQWLVMGYAGGIDG